jgi:outer membrane beta-barrel protein
VDEQRRLHEQGLLMATRTGLTVWLALALAGPLARAAETGATAARPDATPAKQPAARTAAADAKPDATAAKPDAPVARPAGATAPAPAARSLIVEPAPRPVAAVRVQSRFAVKAKQTQVFAAGEWLSRGDFYNSPGLRIGGAYYLTEPLGLELQLSHFWSSLNDEAQRIEKSLGAIPDSRAPAWLALAGVRYSIGYGKLLVGGVAGAIHFEPQAFAHVGVHDYSGDIGPSADGGLGFLVYITPRLFARIDASVVFEREERSGQTVSVWGTLPAIGMGGLL